MSLSFKADAWKDEVTEPEIFTLSCISPWRLGCMNECHGDSAMELLESPTKALGFEQKQSSLAQASQLAAHLQVMSSHDSK